MVLFTHTLFLLEDKIDKYGLQIANQVSQFPRKVYTYILKPHSYSRPLSTGKPEMNDPCTLNPSHLSFIERLLLRWWSSIQYTGTSLGGPGTE